MTTMTGSMTLLARAALGLSAATAGTFAVLSKRAQAIQNKSFDRLAFWGCLISRLGLFGLVFFVLRLEPRGDIPAYYAPEARSVINGSLPYRDFPSSYAPLHPYLDGAMLLVWNSPLAIILLAIVGESFLLPVWIKLGRLWFTERQLRMSVILYLTSAISLQFVAIDGQDNAIIAVFLALATFCLARRRAPFSGAIVGIATALIKILPLLYVPAFLLATRRWRQWLAGFAIGIFLGYGYFAYMKLPLLFPLKSEGAMKSAGNLPYLIESLVGVSIPDKLLNATTLLALAAIFGMIMIAVKRAAEGAHLRILIFGMPALTLTLLLMAKKSWPPYLMLVMFPICLSISIRRSPKASLFGLFSIVALTEHSYWSSICLQPESSTLHAGLLSFDVKSLILLMLELLLIAGYGWLLYESVSLIVKADQSGPESIS